MIKLNTKLQNQPVAYQITQRVNQLISYYGRNKIEEAIFLDSSDEEIQRHAENLLNTYGVMTVFDICENILPVKKGA